MTSPFEQHLCALMGGLERGDYVALWSMRLDESGTDGRSPYTVVGGAVALPGQWGKLERAWNALLVRSKVPAYHWKEFHDRNNAVFGKWSQLKRKRFMGAQEKIINRNTLFRVSTGIERKLHADVKVLMRGIKGFHPDSDYTLALRYLMFHTCDELVKIDPNARLVVMIEDGPWAAGAAAAYRRVAAMTAKKRPAKHAHRLAGFAIVCKGDRVSLEAADHIAGEEHARMVAGRRPPKGGKLLSQLWAKKELNHWYKLMIEEKDRRRAYARQNSKIATAPDAAAE